MNLLITICARSGSKGVKNKNIKILNRYPLLFYTLSVVELLRRNDSHSFSRIDLAINTDSKELVSLFESTQVLGCYIPRKVSLAGDCIGKMDVIRDTLKEMEEKENVIYEIVMDLDLTSPIRTMKDVDGTIDTLLENPVADLSYSVTESRRSPYFNMVRKKDNGYFDKVLSSQFVSRQQVPVCFDMNASIYVYRREYLLKFENVLSRNAVIWSMRDTGILDIDSEDDYELIQVIANYLFKRREYQDIEEGIKAYVLK